MRNRSAFVRVLMYGLAIVPLMPTASGEIGIDFVAQWGGGTYDVIVDGDTAFMTIGARIVALDISNPTAPVALDESLVAPAAIFDLALEGNLLIAAATNAGVLVVDVSDRSHLKIVGRLPLKYQVVACAVAGEYAYAIDSVGSIYIIDISSPNAPQSVGSVKPGSYLEAATVIGDYLYVSKRQNSLVIVDVHDPTNPTVLSTWSGAGGSSFTQIDDNTAISTSVGFGGCLVDISDREHPSIIKNITYSAESSCFTDPLVFFADGWNGLLIYDLTDRAAPKQLSKLETGGYCYAIDRRGDFLFAADWRDGLKVINISNPKKPVIVAKYDTGVSAIALSVAAVQNLVVVAEDYTGLQLVDISDRTHPARVGHFADSGVARYVALDERRAYVADASGLDVINIEKPTEPTRITLLDGRFQHVCLDAAYIYACATSTKSVHIFDRETFTHVGEVASLGAVNKSLIDDDVLFVQAQGPQLHFVDVSDRANPRALAALEAGSDFARSGDFAFIAEGLSLTVVDASDPSNPRIVGKHEELASRALAYGDYLITSSGNRECQILDIRDPSSPRIVGRTEAMGRANDLFIHGSYLLGALLDGGTFILQLRVPADLNCDGHVTFDDIDPFVILLTAPEEFVAAYPLCNALSGDIDGSGAIDFDDIDGFVECLIDGGCP